MKRKRLVDDVVECLPIDGGVICVVAVVRVVIVVCRSSLLGLPLALGWVDVVFPVIRNLKEPLKIFPLFFSSRDWTFVRLFQPLDF